MAAQVYRYRRVSTQAQRQQTKWVILGFARAMVGFCAILVLYSVVPANGRSTGSLGEIVAEALLYGFILLVPLSIGRSCAQGSTT